MSNPHCFGLFDSFSIYVIKAFCLSSGPSLQNVINVPKKTNISNIGERRK